MIPLGIMMEEGLKAAALLEQQGISVGIFNPRFIKPLDEESMIADMVAFRKERMGL